MSRPFYQPLLYFVSKNLCYLLFTIVWRMKVRGEERIPSSGAVIIASNHRSLADPPIVGSSVRRKVHFLAKEELFRFRPFGWLITHLNAHPLKRGSSDVRAFKAAREILAADDALILFPEGRRSKTDDLGPAKAGVGMLAALAECPVVPAYVKNSGHLKHFKPVTVSFGAPLFYKDFPSYRAMADAVMYQMSRLKADLASEKI